MKEGESGEKLSQFLHRHLPHLSLNQIKRSIESNRCTLNGKVERFHTTLVGKGDQVEFELLEKPRPALHEECLFEDDFFLVINKPSGVPSEKITRGLLAHRLDKETSGCLLLAKNEEALKKAEELFKNREIEKRYLAVVEGMPNPAAGVIEKPMGKVSSFQGQSIWGVVKEGLFAKTAYKVLKKGKNRALVLCLPETGRTHQIRVHMAYLGNPIVGDYTYSKRQPFSTPSNRILLHASELKFTHPFSSQSVKVEAPIPAEIEELFL